MATGTIPVMGDEHNDSGLESLVLCYKRQTGRLLWERVAREEVPHEGHHPDNGYASASPVTDGRQVLAYFGSRGLHCYDMEGNLKWSKDFGRMKTEAVLRPWLEIDAEKEQFVGSGEFVAKANTLVTRECRSPFVVPENV